jgi:hypothetical protein
MPTQCSEKYLTLPRLTGRSPQVGRFVDHANENRNGVLRGDSRVQDLTITSISNFKILRIEQGKTGLVLAFPHELGQRNQASTCQKRTIRSVAGQTVAWSRGMNIIGVLIEPKR